LKSNPVKSKKTKTEPKAKTGEDSTNPDLPVADSIEKKTTKTTKAKKTAIVKKTNLEGKLSDIPLKEKKSSAKPKEKTISAETKKILKEMMSLLKEKKCDDIVVMNLEEVNSYLSLFVICTVGSHTQGRAVARELEKKMKHHKLGTGNIEKKNLPTESGWTLLDLGEIIVHIMTAETRAYYDLDKLWGDAKKISL